MKTLSKLSIALAIVVFTAAIYFSPQLTLSRINNAVQTGNSEQLAEFIDFPVLKENLKHKLNSRFSPEPQPENNNVFSGLGQALVGLFVGPLIDSLVTPEGMLDLLTSSSQDSGPTYRNTRYSHFNKFHLEILEAESDKLVLQLDFERRNLIHWQLVDLQHALLEQRPPQQ